MKEERNPSLENGEDGHDAHGGSLLEKDPVDPIMQELREALRDPLRPVRPGNYSRDDLPGDLPAQLTTHTAIDVLRNRIDGVYGISRQYPKMKPEVTSAAWYAEQEIRQLCRMFEDPIESIGISSDSFIEIEISQHDWPEGIKCILLVSPWGDRDLLLASASGQVHRNSQSSFGGDMAMLYRSKVVDQIREFIGSLTVGGEAAESDENTG